MTKIVAPTINALTTSDNHRTIVKKSNAHSVSIMAPHLQDVFPSDYSYIFAVVHEIEPLITMEDIQNDKTIIAFFVTLPRRRMRLRGSSTSKKKQRHQCAIQINVKRPTSERCRNTDCPATINLWIRRRYLKESHPLEVLLKFTQPCSKFLGVIEFSTC
ncbi:13180_t:CDS:2 [Ambispora gerdemannii]|uniref:13180_t:CDS:1 n=1 Tax=Ambispora gerdemannii TaxID=144530 RepID=A0A9N9FXU6_9GLOM|nr:13180_t:CDS:2 [Ambispora gerdemannii]